MAGRCITIAIPTKDRPDFLAVLLGSIAQQQELVYEVLILPNGEDRFQLRSGAVSRAIDLLRCLGVRVTEHLMGQCGQQMAVPRNYAQVYCTTPFLLTVDDDMWLAPECVSRLRRAFLQAEDKARVPVIVSPVTPWVDSGWEGVLADEVLPLLAEDEKVIQLLDFRGMDPPFHLVLRQNARYLLHPMDRVFLRDSDVITPGTYFMRPDISIPQWTPTGYGTYTDLAWCLQLEYFRGYRFFFDLGAESFHLNAESGGTRLKPGDFHKPKSLSAMTTRAVGMLLELREGRKEDAKALDRDRD